ncbi:hypothetical protein RJ639_031237 [Escallonia herrerae]|uniref:TLDc domain-containing protein n=1 Tax=Escallonia herrerae TaxID=1293975 RepID=A0AA89BIK4_9ASTE|nr:hypothetical protein RJ639_031237 [Escallonia herrerae]
MGQWSVKGVGGEKAVRVWAAVGGGSGVLCAMPNDEGPTVLILKDKEGYIYGGYASQPWQRHADFYGDMKFFLFQLYPQAAIFRPTGANSNLQWCAVNFSSESIPNGIGFGGRINHFGMFLSANFDQGHTFSCTTFGSPCMSKANQIYPEVIECWGIVPKGPQRERQNGVKGTVLERFKEDRNMLNMVGLADSSQSSHCIENPCIPKLIIWHLLPAVDFRFCEIRSIGEDVRWGGCKIADGVGSLQRM